MSREAFESLINSQKAEVSVLADELINKMINMQFDFTHMTAFKEVLTERISCLVPVHRWQMYGVAAQSATDSTKKEGLVDVSPENNYGIQD